MEAEPELSSDEHADTPSNAEVERRAAVTTARFMLFIGYIAFFPNGRPAAQLVIDRTEFALPAAADGTNPNRYEFSEAVRRGPIQMLGQAPQSAASQIDADVPARHLPAGEASRFRARHLGDQVAGDQCRRCAAASDSAICFPMGDSAAHGLYHFMRSATCHTVI